MLLNEISHPICNSYLLYLPLKKSQKPPSCHLGSHAYEITLKAQSFNRFKKWEKTKAATRPFTYMYAVWTRKKPAPRPVIRGTSFPQLLAAEPPTQELTYTGPTKINFDPCLFSQVVKDRPFHWPVSSCGWDTAFFCIKCSRGFQRLGQGERTHCLSLPVPVHALLGCREVTGDTGKGRSTYTVWKKIW